MRTFWLCAFTGWEKNLPEWVLWSPVAPAVVKPDNGWNEKNVTKKRCVKEAVLPPGFWNISMHRWSFGKWTPNLHFDLLWWSVHQNHHPEGLKMSPCVDDGLKRLKRVRLCIWCFFRWFMDPVTFWTFQLPHPEGFWQSLSPQLSISRLSDGLHLKCENMSLHLPGSSTDHNGDNNEPSFKISHQFDLTITSNEIYTNLIRSKKQFVQMQKAGDAGFRADRLSGWEGALRDLLKSHSFSDAPHPDASLLFTHSCSCCMCLASLFCRSFMSPPRPQSGISFTGAPDVVPPSETWDVQSHALVGMNVCPSERVSVERAGSSKDKIRLWRCTRAFHCLLHPHGSGGLRLHHEFPFMLMLVWRGVANLSIAWILQVMSMDKWWADSCKLLLQLCKQTDQICRIIATRGSDVRVCALFAFQVVEVDFNAKGFIRHRLNTKTDQKYSELCTWRRLKDKAEGYFSRSFIS